MDIHRGDKRKQKKTAVVAALAAILFMMPGILLPIWIYLATPDIPIWLIVILALIPTVLIVGTLLALKERWKEIEGGELNEASKY